MFPTIESDATPNSSPWILVKTVCNSKAHQDGLNEARPFSTNAPDVVCTNYYNCICLDDEDSNAASSCLSSSSSYSSFSSMSSLSFNEFHETPVIPSTITVPVVTPDCSPAKWTPQTVGRKYKEMAINLNAWRRKQDMLRQSFNEKEERELGKRMDALKKRHDMIQTRFEGLIRNMQRYKEGQERELRVW